MMPDLNEALYELRRVRKTYGIGKRLPARVFRECRLPAEYKPRGDAWRETCGDYQVCRQECPRCWTLSIEAMTVRRDRTTAILGRSGSGKTTLLYLLALLHDPDPDTECLSVSFVNGNPSDDENRDSGPDRVEFQRGTWQDEGGRSPSLDRLRGRHFGFVFQAGHLSSHLDAVQNVGLAPALAGRPARELEQRATEILGRIDFPRDRFRALPRHLSGGEYQRVAVARALAADPDVLFADEPTGNLDPVTGRAVMESLAVWRVGRSNRSLVLVTHNLDHALEFADDIYVLSGGEVVLVAEAAKVRRHGIETALRRRQAAGIRL